VNPDLVACDAKGEIYTVRYDAVNAMLLNEFLKEHNKVEEQETTIVDLRSAIAQQRKDSGTAMERQQKQLQARDCKFEGVSVTNPKGQRPD